MEAFLCYAFLTQNMMLNTDQSLSAVTNIYAVPIAVLVTCEGYNIIL